MRTFRLAWSALCVVATQTQAVEVIGQVTHEALGEVSGIVKSSHGDFYWVHNDSGDAARVFAIEANGTPIVPSWLGTSPADWQGHAIDGAWNYDWEAIALADGVLYVADVGNNGNARRDLGVYVVNEPHPATVQRMRTLTFLPIRYPDQHEYPGDAWHFDCEAVFVANGALHFITKHRQPQQIAAWEVGAKLYRLDTAYSDRENVLTLVGRRQDLAVATGADLSPDGSRLAVASYTALWIFDRPLDGDNWFAGKAWKLDLNARLWQRQLEAVAWQDDSTLLLVNEKRDIMRARVADFSPLP